MQEEFPRLSTEMGSMDPPPDHQQGPEPPWGESVVAPQRFSAWQCTREKRGSVPTRDHYPPEADGARTQHLHTQSTGTPSPEKELIFLMNQGHSSTSRHRSLGSQVQRKILSCLGTLHTSLLPYKGLIT